MKRTYLDHASMVPLRDVGRSALLDALEHIQGDPGRIHQEGMTARALLEHARDQVATMFGTKSRSVVFTSCASEAIAMACWGAAERHGGPQVVAAVEHSAVRLSAARRGPVKEIRVDEIGRINLSEIDDALDHDPSLVHVQWANHEVGTRQPVEAIVAKCRERGVPVHVDAAQGAGRDDIDFDALGADLLSFSGPKFGAPMGSGGLLIRRGIRLSPLLLGGEQERARRAGLEAVPTMVALGAVAEFLSNREIRAAERASDTRRIEQLAALLCGPNGPGGITRLGDPLERAPHLLCIGVAGVEPQAVLLGLDQEGVAVHSGSSCATESVEPSPVLAAMGVDAERSLRISVGWTTTEDDIVRAFEALRTVLARLRALRG